MTIKDFIGQEVAIGEYFAYPLTVGRSASMALYQLKEILDGKVKAVKVNSSYGFNNFDKYRVMEYDKLTEKYAYRDMTPAEIEKVDNKTSTLNMFSKRACRVNYDPELKD